MCPLELTVARSKSKVFFHTSLVDLYWIIIPLFSHLITKQPLIVLHVHDHIPTSAPLIQVTTLPIPLLNMIHWIQKA
jgi:hypothetical protein